LAVGTAEDSNNRLLLTCFQIKIQKYASKEIPQKSLVTATKHPERCRANSNGVSDDSKYLAQLERQVHDRQFVHYLFRVLFIRNDEMLARYLAVTPYGLFPQQLSKTCADMRAANRIKAPPEVGLAVAGGLQHKELTYSTYNTPVITLLPAFGAPSSTELIFLIDDSCAADDNRLRAKAAPTAAESGDDFGDVVRPGDELRSGAEGEGFALDDPRNHGFLGETATGILLFSSSSIFRCLSTRDNLPRTTDCMRTNVSME